MFSSTYPCDGVAGLGVLGAVHTGGGPLPRLPVLTVDQHL